MNLDRIAAALPGYEIRGEIGRGAWGVVLAAEHRQLGRGVAVKQLPEAFAADPLIQRRFASEGRLLASLDHPHIVPIFDYVEAGGLCLLVMELLPGGTVRDRVAAEGIGPQDACSITLATCAALQYAHGKGILHRDIKPENLLFNASGILKVTDFGIAKVLGGAETLMTQAGAVLGTPAYMAPEQVSSGPLSPATDVYAVATMLYELLSGRLPFSDDGGVVATMYRHAYEQPIPLGDVAPEVAEPIAQVVMRGLATPPADRPQSADDLGGAVAEAANDALGPGWLNATDLDVMVSRRVAQRISNPTVVNLTELLGKGEPLPLEPSAPESPIAAPTPPAAAASEQTVENPATSTKASPAAVLPPIQTGTAEPPPAASAPSHDAPTDTPPSEVVTAPEAPGRRPRGRGKRAVIVVLVLAVLAVVAFLTTRSHYRAAATATSTSTTAGPGGDPVFRDNFTDSASGWAPDVNQDGTGSAAYQSDGYYLTVLTPLPALNTFSVRSPYMPKLTSILVSVHATFVRSAPTDGAGVRCDQGSRTGLRYTFEVFPNGMWVIFKIDGSGATMLDAGTGAAATGYTVAGRCREIPGGATALAMMINGISVGTYTDSHGGGPIGWDAALVAYRSASSPATEVRFNDFGTYNLSPA